MLREEGGHVDEGNLIGPTAGFKIRLAAPDLTANRGGGLGATAAPNETIDGPVRQTCWLKHSLP